MKSKYGPSLWKNIIKLNSTILNCSKWIVGNGKRVRFWKDIWCDSASFKDRFPLIFAIAKNKDSSVFEATENNLGTWNIVVNRNLQDWEIDEYEMMHLTLATIQLNNLNDKLS